MQGAFFSPLFYGRITDACVLFVYVSSCLGHDRDDDDADEELLCAHKLLVAAATRGVTDTYCQQSLYRQTWRHAYRSHVTCFLLILFLELEIALRLNCFGAVQYKKRSGINLSSLGGWGEYHTHQTTFRRKG